MLFYALVLAAGRHDASPPPPGPESCDPACAAALPERPRLADAYLNLAHQALTDSLTEAGTCNGTYGQNGKWHGVWSGCDLKRLAPFDSERRRTGDDWPPYAATMAGTLRLLNVRSAIEYVVANKIEGDFAELGVWRGGTSIFAKLVLDVYDQRRRQVHVFDAFGPVPSGYGAARSYLQTDVGAVKRIFEKYGALDEQRVHLYPGLFIDTLPRFRETNTRPVAVLRVDGNFWNPHIESFYYMYDLVPVGGIVILDDGFSMAYGFFQEFCLEFGLEKEWAGFHRIDRSGGWFRKETDLLLNESWFRRKHRGPVGRLVERKPPTYPVE